MACRAGDFSGTVELLELMEPRTDDMLSRACGLLLGDAGTSLAIRQVADFVRARFAALDPFGLDNALAIADALSTDGNLNFVTDILETLEWNLASDDSLIIALHLSRMLEPRWGLIAEKPTEQDDFRAYRELVSENVDTFRNKFGATARIFMAQPSNPYTTARLIIGHQGSTDFEEAAQVQLRRRFEAETGIDCTAFFSEGLFQPLHAATITESFLQDNKPYEAGAKYFFGHRVP